jgi:hypothetical protein
MLFNTITTVGAMENSGFNVSELGNSEAFQHTASDVDTAARLPDVKKLEQPHPNGISHEPDRTSSLSTLVQMNESPSVERKRISTETQPNPSVCRLCVEPIPTQDPFFDLDGQFYHEYCFKCFSCDRKVIAEVSPITGPRKLLLFCRKHYVNYLDSENNTTREVVEEARLELVDQVVDWKGYKIENYGKLMMHGRCSAPEKTKKQTQVHILHAFWSIS